MNDSVDTSSPFRSSLAWTGPFAVFMVWLGVDSAIPLAQPTKEIVRDLVLLGSIGLFSRRVLPTRAPRMVFSVAVGLGVCALWIAPDILIPGWRASPLFQNAVTGRLKTSIAPTDLTVPLLMLRTLRAVLIVPVIEELFWRGWLPRWLQRSRFESVPLGQYTTFAFWATALLFAAEHGPYWEVGLLTGIIYNLWMRRTRSLGDLIIAHATTNAALSVYVVATHSWGYWM